MNKYNRINKAIEHIKEILYIADPDKAKHWSIVYLKPLKEHLEDFSEWEIMYHGIRTGEEYIFVSIDGRLTYALNVTGYSELETINELMQLLANKF